ncbi:hypothetical protein [Flaviaesturariibacter amylovorans]|uniref:Uncharacterized protein n=1 Tax=Flaviaesturariibacter amylovorans TaxID=1084520 RepID=A0ABP8GVG6_9BACT
MTPTSLLALPFMLHGTRYSCDAHIDATEFPCLVFVCFYHPDLLAVYGNEITVKTDFDFLLLRTDECIELTTVRQAILDALQRQPEWMTERAASMTLRTPAEAVIIKRPYLPGHRSIR